VRALVTGVSGFVGHHLVSHLRDEGDDVIGVDREDGSVDILDRPSIDRALRDARPDVVYHLAGWSDVGGSWAAPVDTLRVNAEGTLNLLLACADAEVPRVIAVSSADIYGPVSEDELPLRETAELRPVSPYAASKVAADYIGLQAWLGRQQDVIRVRAFNHLGPGQSNKFVAPALAERVARNELEGGDEILVGNLTPRRDFTDVRDVVRAYRLLAVHGAAGEAYNVCSGRDVAIRDLAEQLVQLADRRMTLRTDPALERAVDVPVLRGDNTKLRESVGWEPAIALEQTLADLLDDMRQRVRAERG
jgi:GDP-4-dehydro-6-deoxy-D-mannose reductase